MTEKKAADTSDLFTEMYNQYYSSIFSFILSRTNNYDASEDICQEVFSRFFSLIESVNQPRAWLYGTARNVMGDYYRERGKAFEDIESMVSDDKLTYTNDCRDTRLVIREIMEDPEIFENATERALFELVAVYDYSFKEASIHLGIRYHNARYMFRQASKRLAGKLKERGIRDLEDLL
jgi:RNA polymerase sigma-70 factor (ECF subfamily)